MRARRRRGGEPHRRTGHPPSAPAPRAVFSQECQSKGLGEEYCEPCPTTRGGFCRNIAWCAHRPLGRASAAAPIFRVRHGGDTSATRRPRPGVAKKALPFGAPPGVSGRWCGGGLALAILMWAVPQPLPQMQLVASNLAIRGRIICLRSLRIHPDQGRPPVGGRNQGVGEVAPFLLARRPWRSTSACQHAQQLRDSGRQLSLGTPLWIASTSRHDSHSAAEQRWTPRVAGCRRAPDEEWIPYRRRRSAAVARILDVCAEPSSWGRALNDCTVGPGTSPGAPTALRGLPEHGAVRASGAQCSCSARRESLTGKKFTRARVGGGRARTFSHSAGQPDRVCALVHRLLLGRSSSPAVHAIGDFLCDPRCVASGFDFVFSVRHFVRS